MRNKVTRLVSHSAPEIFRVLVDALQECAASKQLEGAADRKSLIASVASVHTRHRVCHADAKPASCPGLDLAAGVH
jgi:hypothetical protein